MREKLFLLKTSNAIAEQLRRKDSTKALRVRMINSVSLENTDGWKAVLGSLGGTKRAVQVWLDRFTGHKQRKLWAGFVWNPRLHERKLSPRIIRKFHPHRIITNNDIGEGEFAVLGKALVRNQFGIAIREKYHNDWNYYGFYHLLTDTRSRKIDKQFVNRAVKFFEDLAQTLPHVAKHNEEREVYSKIENRKVVARHLHRERSSWLANERKQLDKHICQVCGMHFEDIYGKLGEYFAESHHIVPLSKLCGKVETRITDLRTVCANCHRMLHRMDGKHGDVDKLRALVRKLKRKRRG